MSRLFDKDHGSGLSLVPVGRRAIARMLFGLAVAAALAACGKRGSPQPPKGEPNTYPRVYPRA